MILFFLISIKISRIAPYFNIFLLIFNLDTRTSKKYYKIVNNGAISHHRDISDTSDIISVFGENLVRAG